MRGGPSSWRRADPSLPERDLWAAIQAIGCTLRELAGSRKRHRNACPEGVRTLTVRTLTFDAGGRRGVYYPIREPKTEIPAELDRCRLEAKHMAETLLELEAKSSYEDQTRLVGSRGGACRLFAGNRPAPGAGPQLQSTSAAPGHIRVFVVGAGNGACGRAADPGGRPGARDHE